VFEKHPVQQTLAETSAAYTPQMSKPTIFLLISNFARESLEWLEIWRFRVKKPFI
jgi:hypothetical protein